MNIRHFQKGDEFEQLKIYNTAAASQHRFKPASFVDLQRRIQARDFDVATRWYAVENDAVVGYCTWQANGRVSYPWCLPGHESAAEPLFKQTIHSMQQRGVQKAFTAYRKDWPTITDFFVTQGFAQIREMVNYVLRFENLPTASSRVGNMITPATPEDVPAIYALDPSVFRVGSAEALKKELWENPYFAPTSVYVMRGRGDTTPVAAGIFITNSDYADARAVDPAMPCFRLGAFGTEGLTTKRIKGLFSFVARPDRAVHIGMDMLGHAANLLTDDDEILCYAAQVATDAPALHAFYEKVFERQGSFPVLEKTL
ncbi:MAG TPA: hypothetical protein VFE62_13165 [Gemmataceae bacterium]|nr:hypothetical protein [Gemmataceae bacterium]